MSRYIEEKSSCSDSISSANCSVMTVDENGEETQDYTV